MSRRQAGDSQHFHRQIDRLTREVLENRLATPDQILRQAIDELVDVSPICAAGILELSGDSHQITYAYRGGDDEGVAYLDGVLDSHKESLVNGITGQETRALGAIAERRGSGKDGFYTALPAGSYGDVLLAIGLLSERELDHSELAQLVLLGRVVGHTAEDARVRQAMVEDERQRAVNLIGLIAHELRTPLTGLRGNIQLALMAARSGKEERIPNRLESAINSVDSMTALVQSLLDVSRLERGTYHFDPVLADLRETVAITMREVATELDQNTHDLRLSTTEPVFVVHDRQAFGRVIEYLAQTAVRYSPNGSTIDLRLTESPEEARLEFGYQGEQLAPHDQKALTTPLYGEPDRSDQDRRDSLPLEMAFCRGVVVSHGGTIDVSDSNDSGERVISIRIPAGTETVDTSSSTGS